MTWGSFTVAVESNPSRRRLRNHHAVFHTNVYVRCRRDAYCQSYPSAKASLDLLRKQRTIVNRYWHDPFMQIGDFTNEGEFPGHDT
jgi:hypothetical protein